MYRRLDSLDDVVGKIMNCNDLKSKKYIRDLKQPRVAKSKPTCSVLFNTANRFLATKMALCPLPLFPSITDSFTSKLEPVGKGLSS